MKTETGVISVTQSAIEWAEIVKAGRGRELVQVLVHHGPDTHQLFKLIHAVMMGAVTREAGAALAAVFIAELIDGLKKDW